MSKIRYFSVDDEFSGLSNQKNSLLSVGMVEVFLENPIHKALSDKRLYIEIKPLTNDIPDRESMAINGLNFSRLKMSGTDRGISAKIISEFINKKENEEIVFVGYCNTLDKIFIDQLFEDSGIPNPFHYETIEISSLAIGKLGFEWGFRTQDLIDKLKMESNPDIHNALSDAIHQGIMFYKLMNYEK